MRKWLVPHIGQSQPRIQLKSQSAVILAFLRKGKPCLTRSNPSIAQRSPSWHTINIPFIIVSYKIGSAKSQKDLFPGFFFFSHEVTENHRQNIRNCLWCISKSPPLAMEGCILDILLLFQRIRGAQRLASHQMQQSIWRVLFCKALNM